MTIGKKDCVDGLKPDEILTLDRRSLKDQHLICEEDAISLYSNSHTSCSTIGSKNSRQCSPYLSVNGHRNLAYSGSTGSANMMPVPNICVSPPYLSYDSCEYIFSILAGLETTLAVVCLAGFQARYFSRIEIYNYPPMVDKRPLDQMCCEIEPKWCPN